MTPYEVRQGRVRTVAQGVFLGSDEFDRPAKREPWSLDVDRAAARCGRGTALLEAPFQHKVPREGFHTLLLPQEWLAANAGRD